MNAPQTLNKTPLHSLHQSLGAKMVPFAGYDMPVQYPLGVMKEHIHTRSRAGLFDVSHMGQAKLTAHEGDAAILFEELVPGGISTLKDGQMRYTQLTDDKGGILDDLMATRFGDSLWLVVNAACKQADFAHISEKLQGRATLDVQQRALLALQGPKAEVVLSTLIADCAGLMFMQAVWSTWDGVPVLVSRCGYTGEDGYEISIEESKAEALATALLAHEDVAPIGLGARDSLRLEAGLCLYGHDIDTATTPAEADLMWSVPKRRRAAADFPGAAIVVAQMADGLQKQRVGIVPQGRAPAREGTEIQNMQGETIGTVTSGGFGPSLGGPLAMGYVPPAYAANDTEIQLIVRGKAMSARIAAMPFVPQNYKKG